MTKLRPWQKALLPLLERIKRGETISVTNARRQQKSDLFHMHREALRAKYGEPRVLTHGGLKREYFVFGDHTVIMFCSPLEEENK